MSQSLLKVSNLTKKFGGFEAVRGIDLELKKGSILGLLGPNGAGKTTTIHMLLGVTTPSSGDIIYFGKNFSEHKQECLSRLNFTSTYNELQGRLTVYENLEVFAHLYQLKNYKTQILELSKTLEITRLMNRGYRDLSAGEKTRVNIVKSLLNNPEILLMDEPTASLDPDISDKMLSFIEDLNQKQGLTILYTSHEMDEVTRICHEVVFMNKGEIVTRDTPLNMTKKISFCQLILIFEDRGEVLVDYLNKNGLEHEFINNFTVNIVSREEDLSQTIYNLTHLGVKITDIEVKKPTLEDVFLQIARGNHEFN